MPRVTDTSPEAERVLAEAYRRMPPERRWGILRELIRRGRALHEAGLRRRSPAISPRAVRADRVAAHYGGVPGGCDCGEDSAVQPIDAMRVVRDVAAACEGLGGACAPGGSMASSFHGIARFAADADLAVEPFAGREETFASSFDADYYVSVDAIRRAIRDRASFDVIHTAMGFKAALFVVGGRPFDASLIRRARPAPIDPGGAPVRVAGAEDVVPLKLEWYRLGGEASDRQWGDVLGVLRVQAGRLDGGYLDRWAAELGVGDLLGRARREAAS